MYRPWEVADLEELLSKYAALFVADPDADVPGPGGRGK